MAYGYVTYPGVDSVLNCEFTDISGTSPSRAIMDIVPQDDIPQMTGSLVWHYTDDSNNSYKITIADMRIDAANYVRDSGGKIVRLTLMDERWQWAFGQISGRYNFRQVKCYDSAFASGAAVEFVDPAHEKTPQELAKLLVTAMGYSMSDWDYSALPAEPRPMVNWDYSNPAQELARLADQFGFRIVPIRSDGTWAIVELGEGDDLPDNHPYQDPGQGIDPVEAPDYLRIVTAPILYECRLPLEPVGKDTDTLFYKLEDLSYVPQPETVIGTYKVFTYSDYPGFWDISTERIEMPDETLVSPQELAKQTVYKAFKIQGACDALTGIAIGYSIPGIDDEIDIQQIVLTDTRVLAQISEGSTVPQPLRAYVEGVFYCERKEADSGNYPLGTRLDLSLVGERYYEEDDVSISFSISNSEDVRYALISFGQLVTKSATVPNLNADFLATGNATMESLMEPPDLFLHTAIKVRDPDTWQPVRDYRDRYIGQGPEPLGGPDAPGVVVRPVIKNDIQPWYRGIYNADGTISEPTVDNQDLVTQQCNAYLDDLAKIYETRNNERRRYIGLYPIDMSGTIQQISYKVGPSGQETIASLNTEHDFELPAYSDRRAREARQSPENRDARANEITDELNKRGIFP